MENVNLKNKGNKANTLLYAVKKLVKNDTFWWNLLPAITITAMFFLCKRDTISYFVGCIGILNWFAVIVMTIKVVKH